MRLNPKLPLSDRFQARIAAQAIVYNQFDPKRTVAELRPDIHCYNQFFGKLMSEPQVQHELEKIMSRTERNAAKFIDKMWDWLEAGDAVEGGDKKSANELRCTAARILAKGYISEKRPVDTPARPLTIEGLEGSNLTGEKIQ